MKRGIMVSGEMSKSVGGVNANRHLILDTCVFTAYSLQSSNAGDGLGHLKQHR